MTGGVDMLEAQALGHERTVRAFSDIAVLCRTHRQLELVEKCLRHDDIPCLVTGREDFLDDPDGPGRAGVFSVPCWCQQTARRWRPPSGCCGTARRICIQKAQDALPNRRTRWTRRPCRRRSGATAFWKPGWTGRRSGSLWSGRKQPRKLVEQWEEQYGTSPALERLRNTAVFHEDFDSLWDALVLGQEADLRRAAGKHWASGAVRLMTLHGAKGLEFPAVFLAGSLRRSAAPGVPGPPGGCGRGAAALLCGPDPGPGGADPHRRAGVLSLPAGTAGDGGPGDHRPPPGGGTAAPVLIASPSPSSYQKPRAHVCVRGFSLFRCLQLRCARSLTAANSA